MFERLKQYYQDRKTYREARDIEAQKRDQATSARRTGNEGKAKALEYEADTEMRRKEAARGRMGGLD